MAIMASCWTDYEDYEQVNRLTDAYTKRVMQTVFIDSIYIGVESRVDTPESTVEQNLK